MKKIIAAIAVTVAAAAVLSTAGCGAHTARPASAASPAATADPASAYLPPTPPPSPTPSTGAVGDTFTYTDGTRIELVSLRRHTLSDVAAGGTAGDPAVLVTVKVTNGTSSDLDLSRIQMQVFGGPDAVELSQVFDEGDNNATGSVAPGQSASITEDFDAKHESWLGAIAVAAAPGDTYNESHYNGSAAQ